MIPASRWSVLLLLPVLAATPGCGTIARWQAQHQDASLRREQVDAARAESKAAHAMSRQSAQREAQMRRLQRALVTAGTPDALAAAALIERLLMGPDSAAALDLAARGAAGAPGRPELAFVQLQLCESAPGCEAGPLETHLQQLDPPNGIAWTYALARAAQQNDGPAWQAARAGLAAAQRVDLYWNRIVARLAAAMAGKAGLDATTAMIDVIGMEAAFEPALQPVTRACLGQEEPAPQVLAECRRIAAALRHGDTTLVEAFGTGLALRLWPAGSAESREVAVERRALRYRIDLMGRNAKLLNSPAAMHLLVPLLTRYPCEQAALRAQYVQLGLDPDPPATWQDPGAGG